MKLRPVHWSLAAAALALSLGGCAAREISRNLYEGARAHDESLRSTPRERTRTPLPGFDEYDRERQTPSAPRSD